MLMNGKEVNHLIVNGEAFDKRYVGKDVEILNNIFADSSITINGEYHQVQAGNVLSAGTKGYVTLFKYLNLYYIIGKNGQLGAWARDSDIKILD